MRVAIVHYWLLGMRGGEKVIESLCKLLPQADIFTLFYDPERVSDVIRSRRVRSSFLSPFRRHYRALLPFMPFALESFDLREYDLIISSESGPAKGVIVPPGAAHVCYCHAPMRYLWDLYPAYIREFTASRVKRAILRPLTNYLRVWDYASSARVDKFIANSAYTRRRIWKTYRRRAQVTYPPIAIETFYWRNPDNYFLIVSEFVASKRLDYAIALLTQNRIPLKVVGNGPEYPRLKRLAGSNVEFCGRVSDTELRHLYARCRALIVPGEEDFGMTIAESLASGKPVIALARGGALEIVAPDCGVLYEQPTQEALNHALQEFELAGPRFRPTDLRQTVLRFSEPEFHSQMRHQLGTWLPNDNLVNKLRG